LFFSLTVLSLGVGLNSFAGDYLIQLNNAKREREQLKREYRGLKTEADALEAVRKKKFKKEAKKVKKLTKTVKASGKTKKSELREEALDLWETGFEINSLSREYLAEQAELTSLYKGMVDRFIQYQNSAVVHQQQYKSWVAEIAAATSIEQISGPKYAIEILRAKERQAYSVFRDEAASLALKFRDVHGRYLETLKPYSEWMKKYRFTTIPEPIESIQKLDQMVSYADGREKTFGGDIQKKILEIPKKVNALIAEEFREWKDEFDKSNQADAASFEFSKDVNALIGRFEKAIHGEGNSSELVMIMPAYRVAREVSALWSGCIDLEEKSPLENGCHQLRRVMPVATNYLEGDDVWIQIGLNLPKMKSSTPELTQQISQLRALKRSRSRGGVSLVDVIRLHDSIVEQLNSFVVSQRSS
jgi:hypothetical protein